MRILVCDDDLATALKLQTYVLEYFKKHSSITPQLAVYTDGATLLQNETYADMAFLDVEMPGVNGIQIGVALKKENPFVKIFIVTAYPDYLDEAMRFEVFRYLSKPIDPQRLYRNLRDAVEQYNVDSREYPIVTSDGVAVCKSHELVCIEARQRKVYVYTLQNVYVSSEPMKIWRSKLMLPCFYSPHRSYIINMRYVSKINKDSILLKYGDKVKEVYLTCRKYTDFKNTYLFYIGESSC